MPEAALAVSWQWSAVAQGGRERVTITLDDPNQQASTSRDGTQSLRIVLTPSASTLDAPQTLPTQNSLVQGVNITDGALSLSLSAPSFGFIASRPAANRIVVEIYRDPLGARWQPDGRLAPPTVTTAPTAPTVPVAAVTAIQEPAPALTSESAPVATTTVVTTPTAQTPSPVQNPAANATPPPPAALIPQTPLPETTTPESIGTPTTPPIATLETPVLTNPAIAPAETATTPAPAVDISSVTPPTIPAALPSEESATTPMESVAENSAERLADNLAGTPTLAPVAPDANLTNVPTPTPQATPQVPSAALTPTSPSAVSSTTQAATPAPLVRARLNLAGPDAWSESQILPPTATVNSAATTSPRNRLRDVGKDDALSISEPSPATQAPAHQPPAAQSSAGLTPTATPPASTNDTDTTPPSAAALTPISPPPAVTVPSTQVDGNAVAPSVTNITITVEAPAAPSAPAANLASPTPVAPVAPVATPTAPLDTAANSTADASTARPATHPAVGQSPALQNEATSPAAPEISVTPEVSGLPTNPVAPEHTPIAPTTNTPESAGANGAAIVLPPSDASAPQNGVLPVNANAEKSADSVATETVEAPAGAKPEEKNAETPPKVEGETAEQEAPPVLQPIYVDEQGNPVPAPPDVPALLASTRAQMNKTRFDEALPDLMILKNAELSREEREDVLYDIMKALFETSHNDLASKAEEISRAAQEAMNFNLDSPRVPDALNILARVDLAQDNLADAEGYVMLMKRRFPHTPQVPSALLALGEKQMQKQNYADATLTFQSILQDYPESKVAKDAARMQTYALYRQGHMQRALTLIDFVERRWPRLYLEDPNYLTMTADIQTRQNRLFDALNTYWTLYNLNPSAPEAASTLYKISELYYALNFPDAGAKTLNELLRAFPQSPSASVALLRLGENGIHDGNLPLDEIFQIFEKVNPRLPGIYYQRIIQEYPDSPETITAKLRLIAWQMWNRETLDAMNAARSFMIDYEDKPESLRARDILLRGFAQEMGKALAEENFERVLTLWERFPQVHDYYQPLEPDLRVALARAQLNRGKENEGMELLAPFLEGPQDPKYGQYVFNLYLASYLRQQNWDGLLSLGEKVANWALPKETRDQLDYTLALSAENLGLQSRALPLWQKLAPKTDIPLFQRAYASYFLARDAERRQDLRGSYQYNLDALGMFTQLQDDQSPYADSERIRESIAALMDVTEIAGRFAESLDWANKYATFVPDTSPDYAGLRFREARLHRKMGDMARWRAILQGIIDKEPDSVFGKMAASELHTQDVARDLTRFTGQ